MKRFEPLLTSLTSALGIASWLFLLSDMALGFSIYDMHVNNCKIRCVYPLWIWCLLIFGIITKRLFNSWIGEGVTLYGRNCKEIVKRIHILVGFSILVNAVKKNFNLVLTTRVIHVYYMDEKAVSLTVEDGKDWWGWCLDGLEAQKRRKGGRWYDATGTDLCCCKGGLWGHRVWRTLLCPENSWHRYSCDDSKSNRFGRPIGRKNQGCFRAVRTYDEGAECPVLRPSRKPVVKWNAG